MNKDSHNSGSIYMCRDGRQSGTCLIEGWVYTPVIMSHNTDTRAVSDSVSDCPDASGEIAAAAERQYATPAWGRSMNKFICQKSQKTVT